jgi:hypothetical protein
MASGLDATQIAQIFLDEDFRIDDENGDFVTLLETVKRRRMKIGGVNVTMRKTGRPNPQRSMKAKLAARRHASKRKQAARKFNRSAKAKNMRRVMGRVRKTKGGASRPRRSGPPRRGRPARPAARRRTRRPSVRRARRPSFRRARRPRRPSVRRPRRR